LRFVECTFPNQIKWRLGIVVVDGFLYPLSILTNGLLGFGPNNKITKLLKDDLAFEIFKKIITCLKITHNWNLQTLGIRFESN
jgi:hypothetical protein